MSKDNLATLSSSEDTGDPLTELFRTGAEGAQPDRGAGGISLLLVSCTWRFT